MKAKGWGKVWLFVVALIIAAMMLPACATEEEPPTNGEEPPTTEIKNPDIFIQAQIGDIDSLDPAYAYDTASGEQIQAIYDEIGHALKKEGILPHHREGTVDSGWLLLDFGDVIVHIFAQVEREYYQLDELWSQASTVVRIQ